MAGSVGVSTPVQPLNKVDLSDSSTTVIHPLDLIRVNYFVLSVMFTLLCFECHEYIYMYVDGKPAQCVSNQI